MFTNITPNMGRYFLELGLSMAIYTALLWGLVLTRPEKGWELWELLPVLPLFLAFWAIIRQYKRCDEFYQRIHAEAFALGALIMVVLASFWGFGENAGFPKVQIIFVGPAMIALWGLCLPLISRRYK